MHYYCQWGRWLGIVAEVLRTRRAQQDWRWPGSRKHPTRRTAFVSHLVRIFNTYTEVSGNATMWDMEKGETFLWFYTVQSRNWQVEGGTPVMVALTPCSDWLSLSTRSSHGVLVCVWRKTTCDRQLGFRCVFCPYCLIGRETGEGSGRERGRSSKTSVLWWWKRTTMP